MVELMATILIIAVLAMLVLGISNYAAASNEKKRCLADMEKIRNALDAYRSKYNQYVDFSGWVTDQRFLNELDNVKEGEGVPQLDPWGQAFNYNRISRYNYKLYSMGPDTNSTMDDVNLESGMH